jgi:hypothetical protein
MALGRLRDAEGIYRSDQATGLRLAREEWKRLKDPENTYSAALSQCFSREWARLCPGVPL